MRRIYKRRKRCENSNNSTERSMFNQLKKMKVSISRVHQQPKIIDDTCEYPLATILFTYTFVFFLLSSSPPPFPQCIIYYYISDYTALENLLNFIEKDIVSFKSLLRERYALFISPLLFIIYIYIYIYIFIYLSYSYLNQAREDKCGRDDHGKRDEHDREES